MKGSAQKICQLSPEHLSLPFHVPMLCLHLDIMPVWSDGEASNYHSYLLKHKGGKRRVKSNIFSWIYTSTAYINLFDCHDEDHWETNLEGFRQVAKHFQSLRLQILRIYAFISSTFAKSYSQGKKPNLWRFIHSNLCWQKRRSTAQYRAQSLQVGHGGVGTGGCSPSGAVHSE